MTTRMRSPKIWKGPITAPLDSCEVFFHLLRRPAGVTGFLRDIIPVGCVWTNRYQGIVSGAPAKRAGSRIPNARFSIVGHALGIAILLRHVFVMLDKIIPTQFWILRDLWEECWNVIIARRCGATCLKKSDAEAGAREICSNWSTAGA